jgi:hypothetical protein
MASGRAQKPQSWNRYSYVLNNPLRLIDPTGMIDTDLLHEQSHTEQQQQPPISVKITAPAPDIVVDLKANDKYLSGVGTEMKIQVLDNKGNPLNGATFTESNVVKAGGTGNLVQNSRTGTTDSSGTISDVVMRGVVSSDKKGDPDGPSREEIKDHVNTTPYNTTTEQTLTVTTSEGRAFTITFQRTLSNAGSDGKLNEKLNANGVNYTFSYTAPVVKPKP